MNKTDKRQFLDEIIFLGKSKEHSSTFVKALKGSVTLKKVEKILEDKRKSYNYSLTNIFRKYHVEHDDLYGELDKIWNICLNEKDLVKQKQRVESLAKSPATVGLSAKGATVGVIGPAIVGIPLYFLAKTQFKVKRFWNNYKNNTQIFSEKYVESY
jgi:hypothetical protein